LHEIEKFIFVYYNAVCSGRNQITSYSNEFSSLPYLKRIIKIRPELQKINTCRANMGLILFYFELNIRCYFANPLMAMLMLFEMAIERKNKTNDTTFKENEGFVVKLAFSSSTDLMIAIEADVASIEI
jgi:hypothetical protein